MMGRRQVEFGVVVVGELVMFPVEGRAVVLQIFLVIEVGIDV